MKPKISSGYLTPQLKKTKNVKRLSETDKRNKDILKETQGFRASEIDENFFRSLCPKKKQMILEFLELNKDVIQEYKRNEGNNISTNPIPSPVTKIKHKNAKCESPTALLRRRALAQMQDSPAGSVKSDSRQQSRPNSRLSNASSRSSDSPIPFDKILDGVIAYVEIKARDQDRSGGAKAVLKSMGAKVKDKFSNDVTHVIFKDGSFTTYQKAKLMNIHLVSILWLEFCRKTAQRQDEKLYPAMKSGFYDNETSMVCSQMQREYEDIIRDEYRRSLVEGTPLPSTSSLINRRRTFMTPSVSNLNTSSSSYRTAESGDPSSQKVSDREACAISGIQNTEEMETLVINDPDCFSDISGAVVNGKIIDKNINSVSSCILKGLENTAASDMELTLQKPPLDVHKSLSTSDMDLTNILFAESDSLNNLSHKSKNINGDGPTKESLSRSVNKSVRVIHDKRKTIWYSKISSDTSNLSLISSNSSSLTRSLISTVSSPKELFKNLEGIDSSTSDSNKSLIFSKNAAKAAKKKFSADLNNTASAMSALHLSTEKSSLKSSLRSSSVVTNKKILNTNSKTFYPIEKSRSTSNLFSSSENIKCLPEKSTSMSDLHLSSEKNSTNNSSQSKMSSLQVSSSTQNKSQRRSLEKHIDQRKTDQFGVYDQSLLKTQNKFQKHQPKSRNTFLETNRTPSPKRQLTSQNVNSLSRKSKNKKFNNVLPNTNVKDSSFSSFNSSSSSPTKKLIDTAMKTLHMMTESKQTLVEQSTSNTEASIDSDDSEILSLRKKIKKPLLKRATHKKSYMETNSSSKDSCVNNKTNDSLCLSNKKTKVKSSQNDLIRKKLETNDLVVNIAKLPIHELRTRSAKKSSTKIETNPRELRKVKSNPGNKNTHKIDSSKNKNSVLRSDSSNSKNRRRRKLYDPDDIIRVEFDDEKERVQKRMESKKRRLAEGVTVNLNKLFKSPSKTIVSDSNDSSLMEISESDGEVAKLPPRRQKHKVQKPQIDLNSSADEQRELLNDVIKKKTKPVEAAKKTTENKNISPLARRKSIRKINLRKSKSELDLNKKCEALVTPQKRRSTLDFVPSSQKSSRKKTKKVDSMKDPTIVCTKLHKPDVQVFKQIVKKLGRFTVEDEVSSRTTHLVAGEPKRTINMLRAMSRGCWVLKFEWVLLSLESRRWLPEEDFEVKDFSPVVQKSRLQRQAFGPTYALDVFENCGPFYVAPSTTPRASDLKELITLCKGRVVNTLRMAKIVVGEYTKEKDSVSVSEIWVLDCITFNKRFPFKEKYLLRETTWKKRQSVEV